MSHFSAASSRWRPFSRSYGAILPSSLTTLLPPALGSSPHPPVSVYGTGTYGTIAAFLDSWPTRFATYVSLPITPLALRGGFAYRAPPALGPVLPSPARVFLLCPHSSVHMQYRNLHLLSIDYDSRPRLRPRLTPDLPRADQLYPGNLGYSAVRIPTSLSLLIPAFSLPCRPRRLSVPLPPAGNAPLPTLSGSAASVSCFSPGHFRRRTSRPVSYYALF